MENQVLSIEQMQELEDLGINISKASMCWGKWNSDKEYHLFAESKAAKEAFIQDLIEHNCVDEEDAQYYAHNTIPTFTLQDILEILPERIIVNGFIYTLTIRHHTTILYYDYCYTDNFLMRFINDNILISAFKMLKQCKQHNYI